MRVRYTFPKSGPDPVYASPCVCPATKQPPGGSDMPNILPVVSCLTVCGAAFCAQAHAAEQRYPVKPIRIIIPTTPGGGSDQIVRSLGQKFTAAWGQQVVVDHRAGAGMTIGIDI